MAFAHARNAELPEYERFFGCPVEFGRAADEGVSSDLLEFSINAVAAPLVTADPKLLKALEPFCDMAAKERKTASDRGIFCARARRCSCRGAEPAPRSPSPASAAAPACG